MRHARSPASAASRPSTSESIGPIPLVLMYHSVAPCTPGLAKMIVSPQRFERQMQWLRRNCLRGVSMAQLLEATERGAARRLVGLTFDDGYQDFASCALPVLQRHGFNATVFALPGRLGGHNEWDPDRPRKALLTADELREISRAGIEVASHGLSHISLAEADDALLRAETAQSRTTLEALLGKEVGGFCYPYGVLDARVVAAVQAAGYDYACAITPSRAVGRFAIPRTGIHDGDSSLRLYAKWLRWRVQVGNRVAVRRHRRGS